jgi:hypothetical protein
MAQKFLTDIQMGSGTTVINLVVDPRSTPPSSPADGQVYYNTVDDVLYYYNGTSFVTFGDITAVLTPTGSGMSGGGTAGAITLQVVVDNSTIEIGTNTIRLKDGGTTFAKLATAATTDSITGNSSVKLTTENAVKTYVDSAVASLGYFVGGFAAGSASTFPVAPGGTNKGDYWRVTSAGTIHGAVLEVGDVIIANIDNPNVTTTTDWTILQTNVTQATETVAGIARLATQAETNTGTNDLTIVTPLKLTTLLDARVGGYAVTIGNGSAVSFAITHGLGTLDVVAQIAEVSTGDTVYADVARTSTSVVTVTFAVAPSTNQYRVIIKK